MRAFCWPPLTKKTSLLELSEMVMRLVVAQLIAVALMAGLLWLALPGILAHSAACKPMRASWYGERFHGRPTASGEIFDMRALTAATPPQSALPPGEREVPLGAVLRVRLGDRSVVVVVNDRGPFVPGRLLDLSRGAAARLGMIEAGVANVCVARLQ